MSEQFPRKISKEDTEQFEREGFSGSIYVNSNENAGYNALLIDVDGKHPRKRMIDTTRVYFVINGNGQFSIGDEVSEVQEGDAYIIPPGHEYSYEGKMQLFEFNVSPDNSFKDQVV